MKDTVNRYTPLKEVAESLGISVDETLQVVIDFKVTAFAYCRSLSMDLPVQRDAIHCAVRLGANEIKSLYVLTDDLELNFDDPTFWERHKGKVRKVDIGNVDGFDVCFTPIDEKTISINDLMLNSFGIEKLKSLYPQKKEIEPILKITDNFTRVYYQGEMFSVSDKLGKVLSFLLENQDHAFLKGEIERNVAITIDKGFRAWVKEQQGGKEIEKLNLIISEENNKTRHKINLGRQI